MPTDLNSKLDSDRVFKPEPVRYTPRFGPSNSGLVLPVFGGSISINSIGPIESLETDDLLGSVWGEVFDAIDQAVLGSMPKTTAVEGA